MTPGGYFFGVCAVVAVLGALATISARNPIRGAMGLLATIVGIAGMYVQLSAQFLAAIQLIVYAGAVVVLFVFVIMLLGPDAHGADGGKRPGSWARWIAAPLVSVLLLGGAVLLARVSTPQRFRAAPPGHGTIEAVGGDVFGRALVPFELSTALLIVAAVGAIAIARSRATKPSERPASVGATRRLFGGAIHPRDARTVDDEVAR
ncbi:MAG: NADH-quinone oxidoreductase subunit J [Polyangiaceae bacterium]|nr:NADH-quinone oxidoreductase subunit J [Polyangiaceae bacterium]